MKRDITFTAGSVRNKLITAIGNPSEVIFIVEADDVDLKSLASVDDLIETHGEWVVLNAISKEAIISYMKNSGYSISGGSEK